MNYEHFQKLNILDLFLDVLAEERDHTMIEFAIGGICNCCVDSTNQDFLLKNNAIDIIAQHLSSSKEEIILSAITTLVYLTSVETLSGK